MAPGPAPAFARLPRSAFRILCATLLAAEVAAPLPQRTVEPFPLGQVTLGQGPFLDAQNRTIANLKVLVDADRMLYAFRRTAHLDTKGASPLGGWEDPTCPVRGSYPGHVLSALAQGYAATGDGELKKKLDAMVAELAKVQAASVPAGYSPGYLSAFPERLVDSLIHEKWGWAPLYAIHKVFAGLLDAHELAGNAQALEVAKGLGLWYHEKFKGFTPEERESFWNAPVVGEYGGSGEALANLCMVTGDTRFCDAAKWFDHRALFEPLRQDRDALAGMHANTQIPKVIGALRLYEATGEADYWNIAWRFFRNVTRARIYPNGGVSWKEDFHAPYHIYEHLDSDKSDWPATAETCCAYNLLKLARRLYFLKPDPAILDYYEHALYNQILASQDPDDPYGHATYYQPMRPGSIKIYGTSATKLYQTAEEDRTPYKCCCGTGLENATKFMESIFFHSGDTLLVNLFIPSTLSWKEKGASIALATRYPSSDTVRLTLRGARSMPLKIRAPRWLRQGMEVRVDGERLPISPRPGSQFVVDRAWAEGSVVELVMPQSLRFEADPDSSQIVSAFYGNILLTGLYGKDMIRTTPGLDARSVKPTRTPLEFTGDASTGRVVLRPFYQTHHQRYSPYWRLQNAPVGVASTDGIWEAERAEITHANRIYGDSLSHSWGHVGGIDFPDSKVRFTLPRTSTAACTVVVYYANGSKDASSHGVSTGFWSGKATYKPTRGWGWFDSTRIVVPLVAGVNLLTFAKADGFAELDAIRIVEPPEANRFPQTFEAEDASVTDANIYTDKAFSGQAVVGGIDLPSSRVAFPAMAIQDSSRWRIRVLYSNGNPDTSTHLLRLGKDSLWVRYPPTGGWNRPDSLELEAILPRPSANLVFCKSTGFAQLDAVRLLGRSGLSSASKPPSPGKGFRVVRSARHLSVLSEIPLERADLELVSLDGRSMGKARFVAYEGASRATIPLSGGKVGILAWRVRQDGRDLRTGLWNHSD